MNTENISSGTALIDDHAVADYIKAKPATIRSQRFKRRKGQPHWFTVDPVMIGSMPRYRKADVIAFVEEQVQQKQI